MIMNATDWNTALFEKMSDEQDKFRDWLKSQPPEEILHHTYEYTVREDIVMAMEQLELTDAQAQALLAAHRSGSRFFGAAGLWAGSSCLSLSRTE